MIHLYNIKVIKLSLLISISLVLNTANGFSLQNLQRCSKQSKLYIKKPSREDEIRRKIMELKREGRIGKDAKAQDDLESLQRKTRDLINSSVYSDKIKSKLGGRKVAAARLMGRGISGVSVVDGGERIKSDVEEDGDEEEEDVDEKELVDLVSLKLEEKLKNKKGISLEKPETKPVETTEIEKKNVTNVDSYRPSRGSWGYFERPKDISKAYGGGKRVGAGVKVDEASRLKSEEETKERLRRYREKAGIDVASEKENAQVIQEAINLASLANQRGMYTTTVSCLEKVTRYCSTNSKVGGKVFLELAMAYEAVGRTSEAITVYTALSKSPIERIKLNAQKLLYGLEAMNFMRNEVKSAEFSRSKIRSNFIDTTGLANIASNFDVVYNTAYVDLDKGGNYYKRLTESLVRSSREARQILLKALSADEVPRLKVIQALRSISNSFDEALAQEMKQLEELESVAYINGVPIKKTSDYSGNDIKTLESYNLASPSQMVMNLDGEWRLQLIADQKGDGVKFFNTTLSWQSFQKSEDDKNSTTDLEYSFYGPSGFSTLCKQGVISFNNEKRIMNHVDTNDSTKTASSSTQPSPLSMLTNVLFTPSNQKLETKQMLQPQQIILVDSVLCVTRLVPDSVKSGEVIRNYFSVWRRVPAGTYSDAN